MQYWGPKARYPAENIKVGFALARYLTFSEALREKQQSNRQVSGQIADVPDSIMHRCLSEQIDENQTKRHHQQSNLQIRLIELPNS
jgi:hypothetical protein